MSALEPTVIRVPRSAYLVVGFTAICATAFVRSPLQALIYLLPLAAVFFVARTATIVDETGLTARAMFGSTTVTWAELKGLRIDPSGAVYASATDGTELRLPCVRRNELPTLVGASDGRIPDLAQ